MGLRSLRLRGRWSCNGPRVDGLDRLRQGLPDFGVEFVLGGLPQLWERFVARLLTKRLGQVLPLLFRKGACGLIEISGESRAEGWIDSGDRLFRFLLNGRIGIPQRDDEGGHGLEPAEFAKHFDQDDFGHSAEIDALETFQSIGNEGCSRWARTLCEGGVGGVQ